MLFNALRSGNFSSAIIILLYSLLGVMVAMTVHEWAHAFAAYKLGDPTAKNLGRMSLDPLKHMDPIGTICLVLFGFGWARPVMVNPRNLKNYRRDDAIISLAGPIMNLLTAFLFLGIYFLVLFTFGITNEIVLNILNYIISINLGLGIFNLIPIPPLDGFHVINSIFIRKSFKVVEFLQRYGFIILIVLLASGVLTNIMTIVENWILNGFFSFWALFV